MLLCPAAMCASTACALRGSSCRSSCDTSSLSSVLLLLMYSSVSWDTPACSTINSRHGAWISHDVTG